MTRTISTVLLFVAGFLISPNSNASAQTFAELRPAETISTSLEEIPDSPGALRVAAFTGQASHFEMQAVNSVVAPKYKRTIRPGQEAVALSSRDKMVFSVRNRMRPLAFASTLFSASLNHLNDGRPHYGTDKAGFGERLGAATLKQTSQSIFSFGIYASLFHEDPRYYVMGRRQRIMKRVLYSASRVVLTRMDSGKQSINWANMAGMASATALTNAYYPHQDRGVERSFQSFGTSFATGALSNEIREFMGDAINFIRHKK